MQTGDGLPSDTVTIDTARDCEQSYVEANEGRPPLGRHSEMRAYSGRVDDDHRVAADVQGSAADASIE